MGLVRLININSAGLVSKNVNRESICICAVVVEVMTACFELILFIEITGMVRCSFHHEPFEK